MRYGLLKYEENKRFFNIGDNIQSLAAKQFLPVVDEYISREKLAEYKNEPIKIIMNGWFTHNIHNWVPAEHIIPLFVSFHVNNTAAPQMLNEKGIAYLKKYAPIGCRDQFTVDLLMNKGIDAYFTGCMTLTLDSYRVEDTERNEDIYIVDPLYSYPSWQKITYNYKRFLRAIHNGDVFKLQNRNRHLQGFISEEVLKEAIYINQEPKANKYSTEEKFQMAEELLNKYARARLVITSRIHCALPCLALGTPVIFINGFDSFVDSCRFDGILELFNRIDINSKSGEFRANFQLKGKIEKDTAIQNPGKHHTLAEAMKIKCRNFIDKEHYPNKYQADFKAS